MPGSPEPTPAPEPEQTLLSLKTAKGMIRLEAEQIKWIKAEANYSRVVTTTAKELVLAPLKTLEAVLSDNPNFLRIHRSYLINGRQVTIANRDEVRIGEEVIKVGSTYQLAYLRFYESFSGRATKSVRPK